MIPIWLALLLSWVLWAIILFICDNFHFGISFQNDIALFIFCAPVLIPIFAVGIPIALCIRLYNSIKYKIDKRKTQRKFK